VLMRRGVLAWTRMCDVVAERRLIYVISVSGMVKEAHRSCVFGNAFSTVRLGVPGLDKGISRVEEELVRYPPDMVFIESIIVTTITHIHSPSFYVVSIHQSSQTAHPSAHPPLPT
jgi:hypothetical protein